MKRILPLALILCLCAASVFAEKSDSDTNNDIQKDPNPEYKTNDAGDQYIKIAIMGVEGLNFGDKLETGGAAELGYHRFISSLFALGFDVQFGYNPTIGSNMFTYVPMTLTATFQPYIGKFEFPLTFGVGAALESYLSRNYFPGLVLKGEAGAFFRVAESWSFGIESEYMYMPQYYYKHPEYNDYGLFITAGLVARYHF
jgi:hypothetical protein